MSGPLAWSHRVTEIPEDGLNLTRSATREECAEIAEELDLVSCDALTAKFVLLALGAGRYRMSGKLTARVTQSCIVTLEPVAQTIEETYDIEFWPAGSLPEVGEEEAEALALPDVEPIEHGWIQDGRVILELLSSALDPYPRKPGAEFEWEDKGGEAAVEGANPFAALKKLKKDT